MVNSSISVDQLVAETQWLHRVAVALVRDEAVADDLVQDTYVVAATEAPLDGRPLRPWLVRVLWNRVKMRTRGSTRRRDREQKFGELATAPIQPDEIVDRIELHRLLAGLVLELPVPLRDVLLLRFFEGMSSSQIGNRLGISASTVRWRLKSAVDELREKLEERKPNRAWVAPLAGLARTQPTATVATSHVILLAAAALVLVIAGLVFHAISNHQAASAAITASSRRDDPRARDDLAEMSGAAGRSSSSAAELVRTDGSLGADHRQLHGIVVDRYGVAVEGAEVRMDCQYRGGNPVPKVLSNQRGEFEFTADRECNYAIDAIKGNARGTSNRILTYGEPPLKIQLRPIAKGLVRVLDDETGAPIPNATVAASEIFGDETTTRTGSDGVAHFDLPVPVWVRVAATDYVQAFTVLDPRIGHEHATHVTYEQGVPTDNAAEAHLEVRLSRGVLVSGSIIAPDGSAVAAARITVLGPTSEETPPSAATTSDPRGRFELTVPRAGNYKLWAATDDYMVNGPQRFAVGSDGQTNIVAHVVGRPEVHGTVVDASFKPVAGARVSIADGAARPAITDAKGRFSLRAEDDSPLDLIARLGADSSAFQHLQIDYGKQTEVVLQIGPSGIRGTAVESNGSPVPGAIVWLNGCCASGNPSVVGSAKAVADANGTFTFDVPRGDFVLSVKRTADDDYEEADDVKVEGGSRDVKVLVP